MEYAPLRLPPAPPVTRMVDKAVATEDNWLAAMATREQSLIDVVEDQRLAFMRKLQDISRRELAVLNWERKLQQQAVELAARERALRLKEDTMTRGMGKRNPEAAPTVPVHDLPPLSWEARLAIAKQRRSLI